MFRRILSPAILAMVLSAPSAAARQIEPAREAPHGELGLPDQIAGTVRDAAGRPIAGAVVELLRYVWNRDRMPPEFEETVAKSETSGADGRYKFAGLEVTTPPTREYVRCTAPGFVTQIKDEVARGMLCNFTLRPGVRITGRVVDADSGSPLPGATVKGYHRTGRDVTDVNDMVRWTVVRDADARGRFQFDGAPPVPLIFIAKADGYEDSIEQDVRVPESGEHDIRMKKGLVLRGLVLERTSGKPVPRATVVLLEHKMLPRFKAVSDSDGRFEIKGAARGTMDFSVTAAGFSDLHEERDLADDQGTLKLLVARAASAEGRVVDAEGRPVPGAEVFAALKSPVVGWMIRGRSGAGPERAADGISDARGGFRIENLNDGADYRVFAIDPRSTLSGSEPFNAAGGTAASVTVTLRPASRVAGRVTDKAGVPVSGASVTLTLPNTTIAWFPPDSAWGKPFKKVVTTDERGTFSFDVPWDGTATIAVAHPGHGPVENESAPIREPGEVVTKDFVLPER